MGAFRALCVAASLLAATVAGAQPARTERVERLLQRAERGEPVRVIVGFALEEPFRPEGEYEEPAKARAQRERIAKGHERVSGLISGLGSRIHRKFEFIPYLAAELDAHAMRGLMNSDLVTSIEEDKAEKPVLAQSVPLIGGNYAWSVGLSGDGWTVAVLDTGVDKTHPFLAGKVVAEACYSTDGPSSQSLCPGRAASSTTPGSGADCSTSMDGCGHGTHVAGIVAGINGPGGSSGVSKGATLIAIKVFSYVYATADVRAYVSDQIEGLERVLALSSAYNIASVNMSLGGGQYFSNCDAYESARKFAIDNLRSVGIAVIVSSGNDSYKNSMGTPACISSAVSVGATCDAGPDSSRCQTGVDGVASYSNIASFITLVAPGSYINSSVQGGGYESWNGTSMAAPHVAGAWALEVASQI